MIWLIFALMAAVAVTMLLRPMLKSGTKAVARVQYDLVVYKDQLNDIDRDLERRLMSPEQADAARVEIQRRMLSAADAGSDVGSDSGSDASGATPRRSPGTAIAVAMAVPVIAIGFYLTLGSPQLPNLPHADRIDERAQMAEQATMFRDMVAQLAAKLEQNPGDGKGWAMMGRSLRVLGETEASRNAYQRAITLMPEDPQVRLEYAALLLDQIPEGAPLPPDFVQVMSDVLALDPTQQDALYFLGMAAAQQGDTERARILWTRLLDAMPAQSEDRPEIERMIKEL